MLLKFGSHNEFSQGLATNSNDLDALAGRAEAYFWLNDFICICLQQSRF
jgi:hypothetical protein